MSVDSECRKLMRAILWAERDFRRDLRRVIRKPRSFEEQEQQSRWVSQRTQRLRDTLDPLARSLAQMMEAEIKNGVIYLKPLQMPISYYLHIARERYAKRRASASPSPSPR